MTCERYWREGVVLVERGEADPHREDCGDCQRAHASRQELIEALPLVRAPDSGDPHWQAKVWRRIDRERTPAPWRWRPQLAALAALACVVALWLGLGHHGGGDAPPRIAIVHVGEATRSAPDSARIDDRLQVTVGPWYDVWIYRDHELVMACRAGRASEGCTATASGIVARHELALRGAYAVVLVERAPHPPKGKLDEDRAALDSEHVRYEAQSFVVH